MCKIPPTDDMYYTYIARDGYDLEKHIERKHPST